MQILWISPYLPLPLFGGGTRVFNLIKALAETCHIDLIATADAWHQRNEALAELSALCRVVEIVDPPVSSLQYKRLLQLRALVSRHPAQYWMLYSPQMQDRINRAVRTKAYDVVVLEHSFMGYYIIPDHLPIVLDQHNVESEILRRAARRERSLLRRAYNMLEYVRYRSDEQRICRAVDLILATSAPDRHVMESWGALPPCLVLPNGVDSSYFAPVEDGRDPEQPSSVVFTGSMHYSPNVEAMLYFTTEIWPLIRERASHATLTIVGGNPPPEILRLGQLPGVTVTGHVPDVRTYLARAQVVVAPLRIGGGTRLKILEALSMGRAVVSTSLGCEGLELQDRRHLLVADAPAAFAAHVTELLADPKRRGALGREGRRRVEELYDWRVIGVHLDAALRELCAGARQPADHTGAKRGRDIESPTRS